MKLIQSLNIQLQFQSGMDIMSHIPRECHDYDIIIRVVALFVLFLVTGFQ